MKKPLSVLLFIMLPVMIFGQLLIPYLGTNGQYGYSDIKGRIIVQPALATCPSFLSLEQPSTRVKKDGAEISILRNGMSMEAATYSTIQNDNIRRDPNSKTLWDVLWRRSGNQLIFVDLTTKQSAVYLNRPKEDSYKWFLDQTRASSTYYSSEPRFFKGVMPVWKSVDSINFIDIHLKEVFPRDFRAGGILDDQYFILSEGPSRYALGDRSGKILTPFVWSNITPSQKPGILIVNMPYAYPDNKAGLINAEGKIILDTLFESIEALANGRHLIIKSNGRYGVCNYEGKTVLPTDYYQIEQIQKSGYLKVSRDGKKWDILNHDLQSILDTPAESISTPTGEKVVCAIVENQGVKAYYDGNLKYLFSDNSGQKTRVINQSPLLFSRTTEAGIEVLDAFFKPILPPEDHAVNWKDGYFEVQKKGAGYGVKDIHGKTIVPEIYCGIFLESLPKGKIFWGMDTNYFWTAYDSTGTLLNIDKKISPRLNSSDFVAVSCKIKSSSGPMYTESSAKNCLMILSDGTTKPLNDSLMWKNGTTLFEGYVPQIPTKDGGFILNFVSKTQKYYFNHRLQNLVQPGYEVFKFYMRDDQEIDYIRNIGLLPMLKYKATGTQEVDSPVQAPDMNSSASERPMILDEQRPTSSSSPQNKLYNLLNINRFSPFNQNTTEFAAFESGGIKNAKGEWVKAPQKGSYFIPISYYLAIEVPLNLNFFAHAIYPSPLKIHKINQPDTSTISINYIGAYYFKPGDRIQISKADPTGTFLVSAYMDEKGDFLTPFNIVNGPALLGNQNLITTLSDDKNQQVSQRIVDKNGNTVKTLDIILVIKPNSDVQPKVPEAFFIVEEYGRNLYLADTLKTDPNVKVKQGIIDSLGNLVAKIQYERIRIQIPGRLFSAYDANGFAQLYDWNGKLIFTFKPGKGDKQPLKSTFEPVSVQMSDGINTVYFDRTTFEPASIPLPDGKTIVFNDRTTLILSEQNKPINAFPYLYKSSIKIDGQWFLKVKEKNTKIEFFIHADSGRVFRD